MPSFPDLLYVPAESDIAKAITVPQRFAWDFDVSSAALQVAATSITVPLDRVLQVTHVSVRCIAGAAQFCEGIDVWAQNELATFAHYLLQERINDAAAAQKFPPETNENQNALVMPDERIQVRGFFNAGAAANRVLGTVWGIMYPRANIQYAPV